MRLVYDVGHVLFYVIFTIFFGCRVYGRKNLPKEGGFILASNHSSYLDPPILGSMTWRRLNFLARDTLFSTPFKKFVLEQCNSIPVRREQLDKSVLNVVLGKIKSGEPMVIFPEGTRSPDGEVLPCKPGIGLIISLAKAPVIPIYIKNAYRTLGKEHKGFRFTKLTLNIGEPIDMSGLTGKGHERYEKMAAMIELELKKLKEEIDN
jgi:1-acyl-sn-glycerol-3-phosphate acyltransferase